MPSPKSREAGFYYGHPQNRFWPVIARVLGEETPVSNAGKEKLLLQNGIAVWDVLKSCDIKGADDNSIKNPVVNDFTNIIENSMIGAVFTTGTAAAKLYKKYCVERTGMESLCLPSTSSANCRFTFDFLVERYRIILDYL